MANISKRRAIELSRQLLQITSAEKILEIFKELGTDLTLKQAEELSALNLQSQATKYIDT